MVAPDPDVLARLARELAAEDDVQGVMRRIVAASVTQIEGAEHAGITAISRNSVTTPVATSEFVHVIDHLQYTAGEGPCLSAATDHEHVVLSHDLAEDDRWPHFGEKAAERGVRSLLSFQLYTVAGDDADTIGALNVYASAPNVFTDESVHTGSLLAAHAAVAATAAAKADNLQVALQSRDTIGQAKGILMERFKLSSDQAFDLLIAASQHTHLKLREVAEHLTTTGELTTG